ncbi:MAG: hypothetical protein OXS33_12350 [bacterium]|nr:hypothetical protein [bacterium]
MILWRVRTMTLAVPLGWYGVRMTVGGRVETTEAGEVGVGVGKRVEAGQCRPQTTGDGTDRVRAEWGGR